MKYTLTPSQRATLTRAPNDWEALPPDVCTSALRLLGLVALRDAPGAFALNLGFQWKITLTGFLLERRKSKPVSQPEAVVIHKRVVDEEVTACRAAANQFSVMSPDAVSSALSKREAAQKRRTRVAQRAAAMKVPETIAELIQ